MFTLNIHPLTFLFRKHSSVFHENWIEKKHNLLSGFQYYERKCLQPSLILNCFCQWFCTWWKTGSKKLQCISSGWKCSCCCDSCCLWYLLINDRRIFTVVVTITTVAARCWIISYWWNKLIYIYFFLFLHTSFFHLSFP